jgi:hypothetical protein
MLQNGETNAVSGAVFAFKEYRSQRLKIGMVLVGMKPFKVE